MGAARQWCHRKSAFYTPNRMRTQILPVIIWRSKGAGREPQGDETGSDGWEGRQICLWHRTLKLRQNCVDRKLDFWHNFMSLHFRMQRVSLSLLLPMNYGGLRTQTCDRGGREGKGSTLLCRERRRKLLNDCRRHLIHKRTHWVVLLMSDDVLVLVKLTK